MTLTKIISLDANQRFNRMDNIYEGAFAEMPIAAGFVRHDVKQMQRGEGWMAPMRGRFGLEEPRTRRRHLPGRDPAGSRDAYGHAGPRRSRQGRETRPDADLLRRFGWSQGGVEDMKEWIEEIGQAQAAAVTPLKVTVLN